MDNDNPATPQAKPPTDPQAWVNTVCEILGWDWKLKRNAGRAARLGKELREAGGTLAELRDHFGQVDAGAAWWWWRDHWKGRKYGSHPTPVDVSENWGAWRRPIAVAAPIAPAGLRAFVEAEKAKTHADAR